MWYIFYIGKTPGNTKLCARFSLYQLLDLKEPVLNCCCQNYVLKVFVLKEKILWGARAVFSIGRKRIGKVTLKKYF
jgi:hypothetical protein